MPYVLFLLICAIWGTNFMLMKQAALAFSGLEIAVCRVLGGAVVLGAFWWWHGGRCQFRRSDWWPLVVVLAVGYASPYTIQPVLVGKHGGALVGMSVAFVPLFTVILSIPFLRVYPSGREIIGVVGALICLIAISIESRQRAVPVLDLLLAGSVPLGYALANICIKRQLMHIPTLDLSFLALVWTALILIPGLWFDVTPQPATTPVSTVWPVVCVILLGTVGTGLANWMFNRLLVQQGPLFAGMVTNLVPLGAIIWGWADQEKVTALQLASALGTMAMVALVQYGAAKPTVVMTNDETGLTKE